MAIYFTYFFFNAYSIRRPTINYSGEIKGIVKPKRETPTVEHSYVFMPLWHIFYIYVQRIILKR